VTKTRIILLASFAVVFAAGVAVGLVADRSSRPRHGSSWLAGELNLTPEQREKMREIWSQPDQGSAMRRHSESRREIRQWRDDAVQALLTEEQMVWHDQIMEEYELKLTELSEERRKAFEQKVARAKEILTEPQRKKYEDLLERGLGRRGRRSPGPFREDRNHPATHGRDGPGEPGNESDE